MKNLLLLPQNANTVYLNSFKTYNDKALPIYEYCIHKNLNTALVLSDAVGNNKDMGFDFSVYELKSGTVVKSYNASDIKAKVHYECINKPKSFFGLTSLRAISIPSVNGYKNINIDDCVNVNLIISKTKLPRIDNKIEYTIKEKNYSMHNKNPKFDNIKHIDFLVSVGTQYANVTYIDGKVRKLKASKVLDIVFPDFDKKDIELQVKDLQSFAEKNVITIQLENDVYNVYRENLNHSIGSCMQSEPYAEMYDKLESCLGVVTLRNKENELVGRALLWEIEINDQTVKFIDKCYILKESYKPQFEQYVKDNGYFHGTSFYSAINKQTFVSPDGKRLEDIKVHIDAPIEMMQDLEYLPYVDRFVGYNNSKETLTNSPSYDYYIDSTCGENVINDEGKVYSEIHNEYIHEDEAVYSEHYDSYIYADEAYYCEYDNDYVLSEDVIETPDGRFWIKNNCYIG